MTQICPHCGAARVMGVRYQTHRYLLVCPRCNDRFYPNHQYV